VDECKPLPGTIVRAVEHGPLPSVDEDGFDTTTQGLTLVHFSAELERFLWDKGCA